MPPRILRRCMTLLRLRILRRGCIRQRMRRLAHPRRLGGSQPQVRLSARLHTRLSVLTTTPTCREVSHFGLQTRRGGESYAPPGAQLSPLHFRRVAILDLFGIVLLFVFGFGANSSQTNTHGCAVVSSGPRFAPGSIYQPPGARQVPFMALRQRPFGQE